MKTALAYVLGFSLTFTAITGGMYFMSSKYPWMFKASPSETNNGKLKSTVALPTGLPTTETPTPVATTDSTTGGDETVNTLKAMLAEKNDSISIKNDSIQQLNSTLTQLQRKSSDDNTVITQLQNQVSSWNSQRRKDLAGAYNDMDAGAAAKIMRNLDDKDIIFILSSVQKKQAAKILGELDPVRAAKLMTSLGQTK
jgi:flagellar motility protein MotE (MotC chaperone)